MPLNLKGPSNVRDGGLPREIDERLSAGKVLGKTIVTKAEQAKMAEGAGEHIIVINGVEKRVSAKTKALIDQLVIENK